MGGPGIGKSEMIAGLVDKANAMGQRAKMIDMRLNMFDPTDIKGIPYFDPETIQMRWAPASDFPTQQDAEDYDLIILLLDELNGAPPAVQAVAYQLVQNFRVGENILPDNVAIVAAGNRDTDKGVTYRMPLPLANRFIHFNVYPRFEDWQEWALENQIHPDVVGYLTVAKGDLNKFDPKSPDHSFPTPRSWSFVSRILANKKKKFEDVELRDMISGTIGEGTAMNFMTHRSISGQLPDPSMILEGKVTKLDTDNISALWTLAVNIGYELKTKFEEIGRTVREDQFVSYVDNAIGFWLDHFDAEMIVMSFRQLAKHKIQIDLEKCTNWQEFFDRYGEMVRDA